MNVLIFSPKASNLYSSIAVQLTDSAGNPARARAPMNMTLTSSNSTVISQVTSASVGLGQDFVYVPLQPRVPGTTTLTISVPGLAIALVSVTFLPFPTQATITGVPRRDLYEPIGRHISEPPSGRPAQCWRSGALEGIHRQRGPRSASLQQLNQHDRDQHDLHKIHHDGCPDRNTAGEWNYRRSGFLNRNIQAEQGRHSYRFRDSPIWSLHQDPQFHGEGQPSSTTQARSEAKAHAYAAAHHFPHAASSHRRRWRRGGSHIPCQEAQRQGRLRRGRLRHVPGVSTYPDGGS